MNILHLESEHHLINLKLDPCPELLEHLCKIITGLARLPNIDPNQNYQDLMDKIHRCSRMCWELSCSWSLTNLDQNDLDLLLSIPLNPNTSPLFNSLSPLKPSTLKHSLDPITQHCTCTSLLLTLES